MTCPKERLHTKSPESYLGWHAWAEKKSRCPDPSHTSGDFLTIRAASPSVALDVERLHRAADHVNVAHQRWVWDKVAREYARLSSDKESGR